MSIKAFKRRLAWAIDKWLRLIIKVLIHCNSRYKQLYSSNKTERFSYKGGCGIHEHMHIEMFKRIAGLGYR